MKEFFFISQFRKQKPYLLMVAAPLILGRDLKISDQNNWGVPEQKIKFGGELNFRGDYEPQ